MRRFIAGAAAAALMISGANAALAAGVGPAVVDTQTEIENLKAEIEAAIAAALAQLPANATEQEREAAIRMAILEAIEGHSASIAIAAIALVVVEGQFANDPVVTSMLKTIMRDTVSYFIVGPSGGVGGAPGGGTIITAGEFQYLAPT